VNRFLSFAGVVIIVLQVFLFVWLPKIRAWWRRQRP
jgi:hypothetical protein